MFNFTVESKNSSLFGKTEWFHDILIDGPFDEQKAEEFSDIIEQQPGTFVFSPVKPGDLVYGRVADYWQFMFYAPSDMAEFVRAELNALILSSSTQ